MLWSIFAITFYQMFLGTQVREGIDLLIKNGVGQDDWTEGVGLPFYIHRSFSWLVLLLLLIVFWINEKQNQLSAIRLVFVVLVIELLSGVLLAHFNMPGLVRTAHLLFASIMFGVLCWFMLQARRSSMDATSCHCTLRAPLRLHPPPPLPPRYRLRVARHWQQPSIWQCARRSHFRC